MHVLLECLQGRDTVAEVVQGLWGRVQSGCNRVREGKAMGGVKCGIGEWSDEVVEIIKLKL